MNFKHGFVVVVCTTVLAACSTEKDTAYQSLDTDKDGRISQIEGQSMHGLEDSWSELDVNMDGQLDKAEFAKFEFKEQPKTLQPATERPQEQAIPQPEPVQQQ